MFDPQRSKHLKSLFALDFGTTKFCLARLREDATGLVVEHVSVEAAGMRRGMLADVTAAKEALATLLDQAEAAFATDIRQVVVGVAGSHLRSRRLTLPIAVETGVVSLRDVRRLMEAAEAHELHPDRELIHTIPVGYRLDDRADVDQPIGFSGKRLTGEFFLVDADKAYLRDLVRVCNDAGLQVVRLYSEPFASASVVVPDEHKRLGVAVADIGGGTTDGLVFRDGKPVDLFTLNVAGKLMTNDLAIGLNLKPEDAENIKMRYGIKPRDGDAVTLIDVRGVEKVVTPDFAVPILRARIHELLALAARELIKHRGSLGAGLLLTGGGAEVKGICEYFQEKLHVPVTRMRPLLTRAIPAGTNIGDFQKSPHATRLATVIGLLNLELGRYEEAEKLKKPTLTSKYLGPLVNWLRELS